MSNIFIRNARPKLGKNQANAKHYPEVEFLLFENYSHSSSTSLSENDRTYSKKKAKNKYVCIHEIVRLIITKMKIKIKSRSRRYLHDMTQINPGLDQVINRPRSICVHTQIW